MIDVISLALSMDSAMAGMAIDNRLKNKIRNTILRFIVSIIITIAIMLPILWLIKFCAGESWQYGIIK